MSLGFQNAGFEIIAAFDNWQAAIGIYRKNFLHPIYEFDLSQPDDFSIFKDINPEMIIGGPPCQDFSSAGKRDEGLGRADLTVSFAKVIAEVRPQWFVMENVERIKKSNILKTAKTIFKMAGYGLTEKVLVASLCGVPQDRKRYFLIGEMKGKDNMLLHFLDRKMAKNPMSVHDYLGDSLGIEHYYRHPRSYKRRGIFSIYEPSPTIRGVNRPVPKTYKVHPADSAFVTSALRPLTTIERSYIQTFPSSFKFEGSKSDLEQMIGNAVPVKLAEFVASSILDYCESKNSTVEYVTEELTQLNLW